MRLENSWAILIPTIEGREHYLDRLMNILKPQLKTNVKVIVLKDNREISIGEKRNKLTEMAIKEGVTHISFIDDDDTISDDYVSLNIKGVEEDYDCNSLVGNYYCNGVFDKPFYHSLKYSHWWDDADGYYRNPNHLNVKKLEKIKDIQFEHKNFGEDGCWSEQLAKLNVLKTEYEITKPFYNYLFRTKQNGI